MPHERPVTHGMLFPESRLRAGGLDEPVGCCSAGDLSSITALQSMDRIVGRKAVRMQLLDFQGFRLQTIGLLIGLGIALLGICVTAGCNRDIDYTVVPPLPPPPGETHSAWTPDTWNYAVCTKETRKARREFVDSCSPSRRQECKQFAAEMFKDRMASCQSLVMR